MFTIGFLLFLCSLFVIVMYLTSRSTTRRNIYRTELHRSQNILSQTEIYMEQLLTIGEKFAAFNAPYEQLDLSKNYWARTILNEFLRTFPAANSYIHNIDMKVDNLSLSPSKILHETHLVEYPTFNIYTAQAISWPYYFDLTTSYKAPFKSITITVDAYSLSKNIFTYNDRERLDYLLTEDGTVLLTNHRQAFYLGIHELYPGILSALSGNENGQLAEYGNYYCVLSDADRYGFRVLSLIPRQQYAYQYNELLLQSLLFAIAFLLITLCISAFMINKFYSPIKNMILLLNTYIPDDLQEYQNEIVYIRNSITKYMSKEHEDISSLQQTLARLHSAQSAVLQHQINNHFLFNTLENIKAISVTELGKGNEVEDSILLLNTIIREGILQKTSIVPLSQELHLADSYLELMRLRFPDVESSLTADPALTECSVFKFSLQPILENCFSHAFKGDTGRRKTILVSVRREENLLLISVRDNGFGMEEKALEELNHLLQSDSEPDEPHHVGIRNVHKRITNVYGDKYGITVENTPPGATVTIRYPITVYSLLG